jgi:hypothetical protein
VIGQPEGGLAELRRTCRELVDLARAVEQRVLGVDVEMRAAGGRSLADPHNPYTVINWSDWSQGDHTSMQADDPTWALTSLFYANPSNHPSTGLYRDEILLIKTDGSQDVRRLAHHHSVFFDGDPATEDYYNSPRANISYDGKFVTFTSNWGNSGRRDVFVLRVGGADRG